MFFLIVKAKNLDFLKFISDNSRKIDEDSFLFQNEQTSINLICNYIIYFLKNTYFIEFNKKMNLSLDNKKEIFNNINKNKLDYVFEILKNDIEQILKDYTLFDFEGYILFNKNKYKYHFEEIFIESKSNILTNESNIDNINFMKDYIKENNKEIKELYVFINKDSVTFKYKTFSEEHIFNKNFDDIFFKIVSKSPFKLLIFDNENLIGKEYVIALKRIFNERVVFDDETNTKIID